MHDLIIKKGMKSILKYLIIVLFGIAFLMPFIWLLSSSLKDAGETFRIPPTIFPRKLNWNNYVKAVTLIPYLLYAKNSLIISIISIIGGLITCSMVAFSITKIDWRFKKILFALIIATILIPYQVTMIPVYIIFNKLHFIDTYLPLVIGYFCAPSIYVFLMRQFFLTIPDQILDSAKIDGANSFIIWYKLMLPLLKGIFAAVGVFIFLGTWSDFLGPLIYINSIEKRTLSLGLTMFVSEHSVEWGALMAASALFAIPMVILFFFAQKQLNGSIKLTGFK